MTVTGHDALATVSSTPSTLATTTAPRHLGIILDGHRRWAKARSLSVSEGHRSGFGKIPEVLGWCAEEGISVVTLWMLSDDNVANRSRAELSDLYRILGEIVDVLRAEGRWRLRHIGDEGLLPDPLVASLRAAVEDTRDRGAMVVNLAIAYGGRSDLCTAIRRLVTDLLDGSATEVTGQQLAARLSTAGQPDPDLVIRSSGELRTSGFMTWQAALAELYFCQHFWPEFDRNDLTSALTSYRARRRRLGK
jgi:short-chain Z-isoprenyl diphosphate synthase